MDVTIRHYGNSDFPQVLALLRSSLTGWANRSDSWFSWKHFDNPAGQSLLHVAEFAGEIVGFRALMKWNFKLGNEVVPAVRGADAVVDRRYRRRGIWESMTHAQLDEIPSTVRLAFSYGHPDTRAGYKKLGWQTLGPLNKGVIPRRPDRIFASKLGGTRWDISDATPTQLPANFEPIERALDDYHIGVFIKQLEDFPPLFLTTNRDLIYLKWRYSEVPGRRYFSSLHGPPSDPWALLVLQSRQAYRLTQIEVTETLIPPGEGRRTLSALTEVIRRTGGDYLAILGAQEHPKILTKTAELMGKGARLGHGNEFLYYVPGGEPIARGSLRSWSFSLGDFDPGF